MNVTNNSVHSKIIRNYVRLLVLGLLLTVFASRAFNQTTNPLDGYTPSGLAPGSPVGSYPLSDFDTINPYSGGMSFNLPLLNVGGRGGVGYTIRLPIEQKWTASKSSVQDGPGSFRYIYDAVFNEFIAGTRAGYGPGALYGRQVGADYLVCDINADTPMPTKTLTRFTFVTPDSTEYELRDVQRDGQPYDVGYCAFNGSSRGRVFRTADGTSATFISDEQVIDNIFIGTGIVGGTGYLYLKDGTTYRFDGGFVSWMSDRNGNRLTFEYSAWGVTSIKDSLNREITISYGVDDGAPYGICDRITYKGFGGAARTIRVSYKNLDEVLRPGFQIRTLHDLFPQLNNTFATNVDGVVAATVWLPDGRTYKFSYDSYIELSRVELPTGGAIEYDWDGGYINGPSSGAICFECSIYRRVTERRVYADGVNLESRMTFSKPDTLSGGIVHSSDYVEVNHYDSASRLMSTERHYYFGRACDSITNSDPLSYPAWDEGKEYRTDILDAAGIIVRTIANTWDNTASTWQYGPASNPRIIETDTTIEPDGANLISRQTFSYDQYNNQTDVYEYNYDGGLLRRTHTDYLTTNSVNGAAYDTVNPNNSSPDPSATIHIRNLPTQVTIYDSVAAQALTNFEYDNYAADGSFHAGLIPRNGITQLWNGSCQNCPPTHDFTNPNYTKRGNVTAVTRYLVNASGSPIGSIAGYSQYDVAGSMVKMIDPRSTPDHIIATQFSFNDCFGAPDSEAQTNSGATELGSAQSYALPTSVTNALNQSIHLQYDFYLGRSVNVEDANGIVSAMFYADPLDRPTKGIRAFNGGADVKSQSVINYDDANRTITTIGDQSTFDDPNPIKTAIVYDGLGRTIESRQYENSTQYIAVDQVPFIRLQDPDTQAWTSASQSSNPYRPNEQPVWNTTFSDSLGRAIKMRTTDNAIVRTTYSGNTVTVTDQTGKARKSVSDGLGRLVQVYEDPANLNYLTSYSYDALDNLTGVSQYDSVSQVTQTRTFNYDSLKRLISATNPESGRVCYGTVDTNGNCQANGYDANGNLVYKTDARGILTTYFYDALNRLTSRSYSDGTPTVSYSYDPNVANGKGRLSSVGSTVSTYNYGEYDALGRVKSASQTIYGQMNQTYTMHYTYDLAGQLTTMTYPSNRTVTNTYDNAGRLTAFNGYLGDGNQRSYSSGIIYSPLGGMTKEQFGTTTPIYNKLFYNSRGQLSEIREGMTYTGPGDTGAERGALINYYSDHCWGMCGGSNSTTAMTDNNGNLKKQEIDVPGSDHSSVQWFVYDSLNRLQSANEVNYDGSGPHAQWRQWYSYDRYGNRTINTDPNLTYGGVNNLSFEVETGTNRLYSPGDVALLDASRRMQYDAAGNLKKDTYTGQGTRAYDGENRMISVQGGVSSALQYYSYDGDGRRVKRNLDGVETWQVYGISGELIAEYAQNGSPSAPQKEYGYRNGQLLITATMTAGGWGAPPIFNDNPLQVGVTTAQARHITELRTAINALRSHLNLSAYSWQYSATTNDYISANPILEMRTALDQALGTPSGGYAAGLAQGQPIKAIHIQELRDRILAAWQSGSGGVDIRWLVSDQLGTPRMIFDQSGGLTVTDQNGNYVSGMTRHDYLPFGEELYAGTGGRTQSQGDGVRQKFTGSERDGETGLDYMQSRYYTNMQGRFTSIDPILTSGRIEKPQSWNRYAYVLNNPLRFGDPSGMLEEDDQEPKQPPPARRDGDPIPSSPNGSSQGVIARVTIPITPATAEPIQTNDTPIVTSLPVPSGPPTPTPGNQSSPFSGLGQGLLGLLPRKAGRSVGAQALFASGDQITGGTGNAFAVHDFFSNSNIAGVNYGGGTHSAEPGYFGYMAAAGVGDGYMLSNARDNEMDGTAEAFMATYGLVGFEVDYSLNKDNRLVWTVTVAGGKSVGAGFLFMPVKSKSSGDLNKIGPQK